MEIALRVHVVWRILPNISGYTGPIFAIFLPYESSLYTDDGSVLLRQSVSKCVSLVFSRGRRAGYTLGFATHFSFYILS